MICYDPARRNSGGVPLLGRGKGICQGDQTQRENTTLRTSIRTISRSDEHQAISARKRPRLIAPRTLASRQEPNQRVNKAGKSQYAIAKG